jgi:hypothetical protein
MSDSMARFEVTDHHLSSDSSGEDDKDLQDYLHNETGQQEMEEVELEEGNKPAPSAFSFVHVFLLPFIVLAAVQGTLAIWTGPHYVGLAVSILVNILIGMLRMNHDWNEKDSRILRFFLFLGLFFLSFNFCRVFFSRLGVFIFVEKKQYRLHLAWKVAWYVAMALILFVSILFLACYTITFIQPSLFLGFPPSCANHPGTVSLFSINVSSDLLLICLFIYLFISQSTLSIFLFYLSSVLLN